MAGKGQSGEWDLAHLASEFVLLGTEGRGHVRRGVMGLLKSLDFILTLTKSHMKALRGAER